MLLVRPRRAPAWLAHLRNPWWAAVGAVSVVATVVLVRAEVDSALPLSLLALCAVPPLAALALAWLDVPWWTAVVLFGAAWADPHGLAGEAAAGALAALSCAALGAGVAVLAPRRWICVGIVLMAVVDAALVGADLLQAPNDVLNAARPGAGLPQLQRVSFGSALLGYGDLFACGMLGGVLAGARDWRALQRRGALLVAAFALLSDLAFFGVRELPATVPVALALLALRRLPAFSQAAREPPRKASQPPG
ncbi:MAG: hypothetical protein ACR2ND_07395 [Solirubrobacteraceae bacterium]